MIEYQPATHLVGPVVLVRCLGGELASLRAPSQVKQPYRWPKHMRLDPFNKALPRLPRHVAEQIREEERIGRYPFASEGHQLYGQRYFTQRLDDYIRMWVYAEGPIQWREIPESEFARVVKRRLA